MLYFYSLTRDLCVAYWTAGQITRKYIKNIIYIFIFRQRRLCVVGIQSVCTYLSSVAGTLFGSSAMAGEHTQGADRSAPVTSSSLPSVQNYRPYIIFSSPMRIYEYPLCPHIFLFMAGYRNLRTPISFFFFFFFFFFCPVIYWSYLWTEISVTLSIGNKLDSRHHNLYFSFLWKPLWCNLATTLNLLSSSLPAKLVYYIWTTLKISRCRWIPNLLNNIRDSVFCLDLGYLTQVVPLHMEHSLFFFFFFFFFFFCGSSLILRNLIYYWMY